MDNDVAEYLQTNLKIAEDYFTKAIGSETDACYEIKQLDMDQNGNALYYVYVYKKNDSSYKRIIYLILKKSDNSDFDIAAEEMRDIFGYQDQLHKFKEENGWVFK
jgi:hypothetical protein